MKKVIIALSLVSLLFSSCGTYSGTGTIVGAQFGTILGSAVGGIAGGWRGSNIGTIAGMAGGAAVGAAIGSAADQAQAKRYEDYRAARAERRGGYAVHTTQGDAQQTTQQGDVATDDRIDLGIPGPQGQMPQTSQASQTTQGQQQSLPEYRVPSQPQTAKKKPFDLQSQVELRNLQVYEGMEDGVLRGGETCKIIFEVMNRTPQTIYNVAPTVTDLTHSKHVYISPDLNIESIAPGTGIRYTATITTGKKLKDGQLIIHVGVSVNNREIVSQSKEITLPTARK